MKYYREVILKNGQKCVIRNAIEDDAKGTYHILITTHGETDFQLSYPEENVYNEAQEKAAIKRNEESETDLFLVAVVDHKIVGTSGFNSCGPAFYKLKHRCEFGVSILKDYWGLGIGSHFLECSIDEAKKHGYTQMQLDVVSENASALHLYQKYGFIEDGRNPRGFNSKHTGYQELVYMYLNLK